jgi:hypothetical protein
MSIITASVQHKRDTAANWTDNNPVLLSGQIGFESNAGVYTQFKVGDGVTAWNDLAYFIISTNGTLNQVLTAGNTTSGKNINISSGDRIEYGGSKLIHLPNSTDNFAAGLSALLNPTGVQNTGIGSEALKNTTTGYNNTAVGVSSLINNTTGYDNVGIGVATLINNTSGFGNVGICTLALNSNTSGDHNIAIGYTAMYSNTIGTDNTSIGLQALYNNISGSQNVAIGHNSGLGITTGDYNTFLGYGSNASSGNLTNATAIGYNAQVSVSNAIVLGDNANVGIGTSSPTYKLHCVGSGSFTDLYSGSLDVIATGGTDTLNIGTGNADVINIGRSGATVNILGTALYEYAANQYVLDKLITLNYNGAAGSATGAGFEIEENSVITGYFKTNSSRNGFDILSPAIAYKSNLSLASLTADRTHTLPNVSGTLISTGDTGSVTNAMLAGSIAYSKLSLSGSIVNADISASAAIAYSKLSLTGSLVNADVSVSAAIAYSKLALTSSIVNGDMALTWTNYGSSLAATGYSGSVTYLNSRYMKIGKICILQVFFTGTSNATTCTITLPFAAANNVGENQVSILAVDNNGTKGASNGFTTANSTTMTIQGTMLTSSSWSAVGTKQVAGVITYETV